MNPAAPSRNLHHTLSHWRSEQEMWEELQRDHAEAEYFAHVEGATHDYPLTCKTDIILVNESESLPF
jgi:hypothetical protein